MDILNLKTTFGQFQKALESGNSKEARDTLKLFVDAYGGAAEFRHDFGLSERTLHRYGDGEKLLGLKKRLPQISARVIELGILRERADFDCRWKELGDIVHLFEVAIKRPLNLSEYTQVLNLVCELEKPQT